MKSNACLALLGVFVASCGGRALIDDGATGSSNPAGGASGALAGAGGALPNAAIGNGVAGAAVASLGGSSLGSAPGGASGTAGNTTDAGVGFSAGGMSCADLGAGCLSKPSDASCATDDDCLIATLPNCSAATLIGINKQGKIVCIAPPCVPPPAGSQSITLTQDCASIIGPEQTAVHCVGGTCLTSVSTGCGIGCLR